MKGLGIRSGMFSGLCSGMRLRPVMFFGLLLTLSACNTPNGNKLPALEYESVAARQAALMALQHWRAEGRIALSTASEGFSAAMDWQQMQRDFDITLTAALGQRALQVSQNTNRAILKTRGRDAVSGEDAEELLLRELGVRVPLRQLSFWMRGLPGDLQSARTTAGYDKSGRLQTLTYTDLDGTAWRADFTGFQQLDRMELPQRIDVKSADYSIRVVIREWSKISAPVSSPNKAPNRLSIPGA